MEQFLDIQGAERISRRVHSEIGRLERLIRNSSSGGSDTSLDDIHVFVEDGELRIPTWCNSIKVTACAGGGRGGTTGSTGAGGGAQTILNKLFSVVPGSIIPFTIGKGGSITGNPDGTNTVIGDLITLWAGQHSTSMNGGLSGGPGGGHGASAATSPNNVGIAAGRHGFPGVIGVGGNPGLAGTAWNAAGASLGILPGGGGGSIGDGGSGGLVNTGIAFARETTGIFKGGLPGQAL